MLNFRGSKFLQIAVFEHFIEIISLPKPCACHTRRTRNVVWAWHTSTVTPLSAWACSCQEGSTYFEGISLKSAPCRFGSLVLECCLSNLLQSEHENCGSCIKNFHWNNFANGWKFAKFAKWKTHEILVLYGNIHTVVLGWNGTYLIARKFNGGLKLAVWRFGGQGWNRQYFRLHGILLCVLIVSLCSRHRTAECSLKTRRKLAAYMCQIHVYAAHMCPTLNRVCWTSDRLISAQDCHWLNRN